MSAPYRVVPDLHRLGGELFGRVERGHFQADALLEPYLEKKLAQLERHAPHCRRLARNCDEEGLQGTLWGLFALLAEEQPELAELTARGGVRLKALGLELDATGTVERRDPNAPLALLGERAAAWLDEQTGVLRLADALALTVQEDFVLMKGDANGHGAELLHVCFPSHWRPAENAGLAFAAIHAPVAHNARLLASARNVMQALFSKGSFVRYTWGLVTEPRLDHNPALPDYPRPLPAAALQEALAEGRLGQQVFLRVERQTTRALGAGRCLFTIRVSVRPLEDALTDAERKRTLAAALAGMDEALLAYKGLCELRAPLLAWLERS